MSFRVVAKVLRYSEETLACRLILIVLAEVAHDDGVVFQKQDEIAKKARLSRTHVAEMLREMEARGVLEVRKAQRGRKRVAVYRLVSVPGLDEIDYERLPFALDEPFTTSEVPTPSDADDVGSSEIDDVGSSDTVESDDVGISDVTTSESPTSVLSTDLERSLDRSFIEAGAVEDLLERVPKAVDRKRTTRSERELAAAVLAIWNQQTGQRLAAGDWLAKIVMRIREYPGLAATDHADVIAASLAAPWWKGSATPSVVYGNGAQFERSIMAAARPAENGDAKTPLRYGRGMTTRQMLDQIRSGELRAAVERINR